MKPILPDEDRAEEAELAPAEDCPRTGPRDTCCTQAQQKPLWCPPRRPLQKGKPKFPQGPLIY